MTNQLHFFKQTLTKSRTEQDRLTDRRLKVTYGISLTEYEEMVKEQGGCCAICHRPGRQALGVDHSHSTGKIRRLLCHSCNLALGQIDGSIERAEALVSYLRAHGEG